MLSNRRNFIKKAAVTTPGVALIGATYGISSVNPKNNDDHFNTDLSSDNGWLDVSSCGASGSKFGTTAATKQGSRQIAVENVGDFKVGQGIMVSKCNIRYEGIRMTTGLAVENRRKVPVENHVEIRGYDGSAGSWLVFVLDIAPSATPAFRWTDDIGRTWHPEVPITNDWQPLSGGIEVRLNPHDWGSGYVISFSARDQLRSRIEKIEGNILTLTDEANRTVSDAIIRHNDTAAIQEAIDLAISKKLNLFIPSGHYMLAETLLVSNAQAVTIEGSGSTDTILDLSEGEGSCFKLVDGTEVTIRNFCMIGFMGFDERDKAGNLRTRGSGPTWGFGLKYCCAIGIFNTERVLVENCHASRMSGECFFATAWSRSRGTVQPGQSYTQWITYRRCSVTDSARNAFNDGGCGIENTSVLNCRIVDVGGCAWESASRFVKFTGNYVRNAGTVAIGNLGVENRDKTYPELGSGQHVIADNVFESIVPYGGCAIRSTRGASQVIVRNNLFINFNSSAIESVGSGGTNGYASANTTITGNIFDMTCIGQISQSRAAIMISSNDTIVSDNQVYVRGQADPLVKAIRLIEPALNVNVHDNLIRNCGIGIISERGVARIGEVIDDRTFLCSNWSLTYPMEINRDKLYKGWSIAWRESNAIKGMCVIESFDPDTLCFKLREPRQMKVGDILEFIAPSLQWTMHDNTVADCLRPVVLNSYGSRTSLFKDNLVTRGHTQKVQTGIEIHGSFQLIDNRITDFNEEKATAIALYPDIVGRIVKCQYQGNIFENCLGVVTESQPGLWKNSISRDNLTVECIGKIPK
jgi:hypothetical protein